MVDYRHAVYAGSFDPVTFGHTAVIARAARLYERVTVAIGFNPDKKGFFSIDERIALLKESLKSQSHVEVAHFNGLLVDFCKKIEAGVIVRGLRLLTDFEYEFQLGLANRDIASELETVFILTESEHVYISSSLVKQIAANGGDTSKYVSSHVVKALSARRASVTRS